MEVYVTLIAVQPLVATKSSSRVTQQNRPQATGLIRGGNILEARSKKRVVRGAQRIRMK